MSQPLNCHFVSRFLTAPWESGQRQLHFYDFNTKQLSVRSSRSLFAVAGSNSAETEARLNRLVETPIASARATLVRAPATPGAIEIKDPLLLRALTLLLPLQPLRTNDGSRLEEILALSEAELDGIVQAGQQSYQLVRVRAADAMPMFYPSLGFFLLPAEDPSGRMRGSLAIPLTPQFCFALVPLGADLSALANAWVGGVVSNLSVGVSSPQVVVHPDTVAAASNDALCRAIESARAESVRLSTLCRAANEALERLDSAGA
jgi:hypothetical protein